MIMKYFTILYGFFWRIINNSHGCEIASIGHFNSFTFEEIQSKLNYTRVLVVKREPEGFLVQLNNKQTEILMWYYPDGTFKNIESEYWKDMDVRFGKR